MELILITPEQLENIFNCALKKALKAKPLPELLPDRCTLRDASELTGLSKSKLYKLVTDNLIPYKRFAGRLVFSRKDLNAWVESNTINKNDGSSTSLNLAASARKKTKRG